MECLAHAVSARNGIGIGRAWRGECLALTKMILGVIGIDTCKILVIVGFVSINSDTEVSAVAEGCADDIACVLTGRTIEREHHLVTVGCGIAESVLVLYLKHACL